MQLLREGPALEVALSSHGKQWARFARQTWYKRGKASAAPAKPASKAAALPPEQNATAWAQRLGITDPKAMKAFIVDFLRLEPGYQGLPVPPPDASRCQICRRKVFLDSKDKKECNGLCISGVKAKTILALRGQGKTMRWGGPAGNK